MSPACQLVWGRTEGEKNVLKVHDGKSFVFLTERACKKTGSKSLFSAKMKNSLRPVFLNDKTMHIIKIM